MTAKCLDQNHAKPLPPDNFLNAAAENSLAACCAASTAAQQAGAASSSSTFSSRLCSPLPFPLFRYSSIAGHRSTCADRSATRGAACAAAGIPTAGNRAASSAARNCAALFSIAGADIEPWSCFVRPFFRDRDRIRTRRESGFSERSIFVNRTLSLFFFAPTCPGTHGSASCAAAG